MHRSEGKDLFSRYVLCSDQSAIEATWIHWSLPCLRAPVANILFPSLETDIFGFISWWNRYWSHGMNGRNYDRIWCMQLCDDGCPRNCQKSSVVAICRIKYIAKLYLPCQVGLTNANIISSIPRFKDVKRIEKRKPYKSDPVCISWPPNHYFYNCHLCCLNHSVQLSSNHGGSSSTQNLGWMQSSAACNIHRHQ
jgi:hypothetical protein